MARRLELLACNVIEAGFPASSRGDLQAVKAISALVKTSTVAALCRALESDIDAAWEALAGAAQPRIHIFLATSPIHNKAHCIITRNAADFALSAVLCISPTDFLTRFTEAEAPPAELQY